MLSHWQPSSSSSSSCPHSPPCFPTHLSGQQPLPEPESHSVTLHSDTAAATPALGDRNGQFREETENFTLRPCTYVCLQKREILYLRLSARHLSPRGFTFKKQREKSTGIENAPFFSSFLFFIVFNTSVDSSVASFLLSSHPTGSHSTNCRHVLVQGVCLNY